MDLLSVVVQKNSSMCGWGCLMISASNSRPLITLFLTYQDLSLAAGGGFTMLGWIPEIEIGTMESECH